MVLSFPDMGTGTAKGGLHLQCGSYRKEKHEAEPLTDTQKILSVVKKINFYCFKPLRLGV